MVFGELHKNSGSQVTILDSDTVQGVRGISVRDLRTPESTSAEVLILDRPRVTVFDTAAPCLPLSVTFEPSLAAAGPTYRGHGESWSKWARRGISCFVPNSLVWGEAPLVLRGSKRFGYCHCTLHCFGAARHSSRRT